MITILGGNGYVGRKCIKKLINIDKTCVINVISRKGLDFSKLEISKDDYNRIKNIKGDALNPESFADVLSNSTGVIHSVGALMTLADNASSKSYEMMNKQTALRPANYINEHSKILNKINFVYISAERGLTFPLSLLFSGYIKTKRETEEALSKLNKLSLTILKPGVIKDNKTRPMIMPIYHAVNLLNSVEKNILNKLCSNIGEKLQLPSEGTELEILAEIAARSALGQISKKTFSSEDLKSLKFN